MDTPLNERKRIDGIRTHNEQIPQETWFKPWKDEKHWIRGTPSRGNPASYMALLMMRYKEKQITAANLQKELLIYANHPDETVAWSALVDPHTAFACSQKVKAKGRENDTYKKILRAISDEHIHIQAWLWDQTVRRATEGLEKEGAALTPLAASLINAAQTVTGALTPERAPEHKSKHQKSEHQKAYIDVNPSKTAAEGAKELGSEIEHILKRFSKWTQENATPYTDAVLNRFDTGHQLKRTLWENSTLPLKLQHELDELGKGRTQGPLLRQLLPSEMAVAGAFQNPLMDMNAAQQIAFWMAAQKTALDPYPHYKPVFQASITNQFLFEFSKAGGKLTETQAGALTTLLKGDGAKTERRLENLTLLPQVCEDKRVVMAARQTNNPTTLLRMALNGPAGEWSRAAMTVMENGETDTQEQAAQIVRKRAGDVTEADEPWLIKMAAGTSQIGREVARETLARKTGRTAEKTAEIKADKGRYRR